jgi:hypothetical protein
VPAPPSASILAAQTSYPFGRSIQLLAIIADSLDQSAGLLLPQAVLVGEILNLIWLTARSSRPIARTLVRSAVSHGADFVDDVVPRQRKAGR